MPDWIKYLSCIVIHRLDMFFFTCSWGHQLIWSNKKTERNNFAYVPFIFRDSRQIWLFRTLVVCVDLQLLREKTRKLNHFNLQKYEISTGKKHGNDSNLFQITRRYLKMLSASQPPTPLFLLCALLDTLFYAMYKRPILMVAVHSK